MKKHSCSWIMWLSIAVSLSGLASCNSLVTPNSEAAARKWLTAELDKWVAGGQSKANTFSYRIKMTLPPLSYQIRTMAPIEVSPPIDVLSKHEDIKGKLPGFRVIVDLDFRSQANTEIKEVGEYQLVWVAPEHDWYLDEKM